MVYFTFQDLMIFGMFILALLTFIFQNRKKIAHRKTASVIYQIPRRLFKSIQLATHLVGGCHFLYLIYHIHTIFSSNDLILSHMLFQVLTDNFNCTVITAHGASLIIGFVLAAAIFLSLYRVDSQIKLRRPNQNLTCSCHLQVPLSCLLVAVSQISGMRSDTCSNDALAYII